MTSNIDIIVRCVDNDNARMIASLPLFPPVASDVAITIAAMAPLLSVLTTSSLLAGTASKLASAEDGAPPTTSSSTMADDDDDENNDGGTRGVAPPVSS